MELTPELFEKTEFAERRKGYDIDQVEKFLEDAGTALAHLLVQTRRTEDRAAQAESRLAEVDSVISDAQERAAAAEARAKQAETAAASRVGSGLSEEAEVEQAAKTLLMARRTGEAMEAEARSQAQALLGEAKSHADRQLADAQAESDEMIKRAKAQAEEEFADRRALVLGQVESLEERRSHLGEVVMQLDARLASYREDLSRTAEELTLLASDPDRLGARPPLSIPTDDVAPVEPWTLDEVQPDPEPSNDAPPQNEDLGDGAEVSAEDAIEARSMTAEVRTVETDDGGPPTQATGVVTGAASPPSNGESDGQGRLDPGAFSTEVSSRGAGTTTAAQPGAGSPTVSIDGDPVTGSVPPARDRYLQELDDAVNEDPESDEAMTAFFEGSNEARNRRFGWRR